MQEKKQFDLNYIFYLLKKYWVVILSTVVLGFVCATVFNELCTPLYKSEISLFTWNRGITDAIRNIKEKQEDKKTDKAQEIMMYNNIISQSMYLGERLISDYVNIMKNPYVKGNADKYLLEQGFKPPLEYKFKCLTRIKSCIMKLEVISADKKLSQAAANSLVKAFQEEQQRLMNIKYAQEMHSATFPEKAFFPRKKLNMLIGILAGILIGIGLAFILDHLDVTIKNPDDLKKVNLLPLGSIPYYVDIDALYSPEGKKAGRHGNSVLDSIRIINTTISFLRVDNPPKVISLTSAMPGAGKSTQSLLLAKVMGAEGKKVLVIDCDLRRPRMYKNIKLAKDKGLVDYLADNSCNDPGDYVQKNVFADVDLMPHGIIPPNPTELLGSKRFVDMIAKLKEAYDCILLDSPPCSGMADAMVIGKSVDAIVLVVDSGKTRIHEVVRNMEQLDAIGNKVIGAILNKVNYKKSNGYYYNYGYYYTEEKTKS